jgi:CheY-like chemotaxis protein
MRAAILQGASASTLRAAMHAGGCRSMRETALAMVAEGITSLDEVNRVVPDDEAGPRRAGKARRVAVVDDDPTMRLLLRLLLEREGFEVLEGENGEQAVAVVRRERPELLVIDLTMPGLDGYEAIGAIRRELSLARLPVIVLTAENGPGIQQRVLELGADDYLVKPFDAGVLLARVRAALRRSERLAA